jgi:hypothetical protein
MYLLIKNLSVCVPLYVCSPSASQPNVLCLWLVYVYVYTRVYVYSCVCINVCMSE